MRGLLVGLLAAVLCLGFQSLDWSDGWERACFDWQARLMAKPGEGTGQIRLIVLDQASLDWGLQENSLAWPWPREVYGVLAAFCERTGANSFALDVLFTEPSFYGVTDDLALAADLAQQGHAVTALFLGDHSGSYESWPELAGGKRWGLPVADGGEQMPLATQALLPILELANSVAAFGNTHLPADEDGIYRRVAPFTIFAGQRVPAFGLAAFLAAQTTIHTQEETLILLQEHLPPVAPDGKLLLRYRGPSGTHRVFSAAAVIQSELLLRNGLPPLIDPSEFSGKYVLFGLTAPGLYDLRPAPVAGAYPGVEVHATFLDNLLSGDFLAPAPSWVGRLMGCLLGLLAGFLGCLVSRPQATLLVALLAAATALCLVLLGYRQGVWLPLAIPELGVFLACGLALAVNYAVEGRQKRFLKAAFRQYLSPEVIEGLLTDPQQLRLGGETRVLTMFFSDLQGFTGFAEQHSPADLTAFLNEYLTAMTDIILEEGGTVDKFVGDAIVAFWNAPTAVDDHAGRAVRAALRCQKRLAALNEDFAIRGVTELVMRVGIHTGAAVVGNMGSHHRFDYTMLGDAVNLASRLEGANKEFGTRILVSAASCAAVSDTDVFFRELGRLVVVGKQEVVTVFEALPHPLSPKLKKLCEKFDEGLVAFYAADLAGAARAFADIAGEDPAASAYLARLKGGELQADAGWRGEWVMSGKH